MDTAAGHHLARARQGHRVALAAMSFCYSAIAPRRLAWSLDGGSRLRPRYGRNRRTGCREIVIDDQTGLLVPIEDPQALARAIVTLASSVQLRARYAKAARDLVVRKLSTQIIGEQIVRLYSDTISGRERSK